MTEEQKYSCWQHTNKDCSKCNECDEKPKVIIKVGNIIELNNEVVTITEIMENVGFYYKNETDEIKFCNTMFETLNFEPVFEQ